MSETRTTAETLYPNNASANNASDGETQPSVASPAAVVPTETPEAPTEEKPPEPTSVLTGAEEAPTSEPLPEPFAADKITFPEGVTPDPEVFAEFGKIAEAHKIPLAAAQELMDLHHRIAESLGRQSLDAWKTTRERWVAEVKADPDVGGSNLQGVVRDIAKVMDNPALTHPKFRELMEVTGGGDALPIIWTLNQWAKALTEGTYVGGDAPSRRAPRSLAEVMYPNLSNSDR